MNAALEVATNALCRAQDILAGGPVKPMLADPALLWPTDEGQVGVAALCALHPAAGLLSEAGWSTHAARHGTAATCSCGAVARMPAGAISVGFDVLRSPDAPPDSGWPCLLLDGTGFTWTGPMEVRSIKTCVGCSMPPVIQPVALAAIEEGADGAAAPQAAVEFAGHGASEPAEPITRRRRIWFGRRPANRKASK